MTPRAAFWCALSIWALPLAMTATALIYNQVQPLPPKLGGGPGNALTGTVMVAFIVGFATVGALLGWKRPANPIGWLLSATGLSYAVGALGLLLLHFPRTRAWSDWLGWIWFFGLGFVIFVLLLFPAGSLSSRRWRPVAWAAAAGIAAWALGNAFAPTLISAGSPPVRNPIGVAGPAGHVFYLLGGAGVALIAATGVAAVLSLVFRYRRAGTVEREQLKWLVYAGGLIVAAVLAAALIKKLVGPDSPVATNLENATSSGAVALVPIAIGIAIFRYHLYDIDVVTNKTLVYGSLAVFITTVYVAIVVGVGSLAQYGARPSLGLSIAATAVVAVAFQPVRERIQRFANRLVYGRRAAPYEVLADFAGRMARSYAAEDLLPRMARILAEGTGAARADVWLKSGDTFFEGAVWPPGVPAQPPTSRSLSTSPLECRTSSRLTTRSSMKRPRRWTGPGSSCRRIWPAQNASITRSQRIPRDRERQEFDMSEPLDWNAKTIAELRANEGRVGGVFEGAPIVLVHHRGRKSGREYVTPTMYLPHDTEPDIIYVFATKAGAPSNPDWYYNLAAAGDASVERGTETYKVTVRELTGPERDRIYAEQARRYPGFAEYARQTAGVRTIPVLELRRA